MHTGTTTSPAHAPACCPGVVSSLRWRGSRSLAKRSVRNDGSCRSSGCRAQQLRRFTPATVAASTSLFAEQRATAKLCAATQRSSPPSLALAAPSPVPMRGRGSRSSRRADPELTRGGPQRLVVLAEKSGAVGATSASSSSVPYSGSVSNAPHHPCAPLQPRAGRAAGGVCCRLPCSEPSPAPRSESGPCRRCQVRQTRSRWVTCWTSRLRAPRAGCRCASTP